jgi:hypothetical protein
MPSWEDVLTSTKFCGGGRPRLFKLGAIDAGGRLTRQASCPLRKGFWLDGFLGVEPRSVGIVLTDGFCKLGGG